LNSDNDTAFVEKYADTVYKLALSRTKDQHSASDVFQEVFYRYFKKRPCFTSDEHEKAWIIRVTINCSKSFLSSFWNKNTVPIDETLAAEQAETNEIYDVVMQLPMKYRTVIFLFYYEGFTIAEIARAMNQKENTVKSHLFRARTQLKERLVEYEF
jgi:RNA polymerase sigma-70 factor (ECF subfamily)